MANKITITMSMKWTDGSGSTLEAKGTNLIDQAGDNVIENIQNVGTSAEAVVMGDVAPGYVAFKNLDTTNFVTIGSDNAVANVICKLKAGEIAIVPTALSSIYAKADTAGIRLLVLAVDA
jgi:hypothetical protein